jgi:ribosomal protein S11
MEKKIKKEKFLYSVMKSRRTLDSENYLEYKDVFNWMKDRKVESYIKEQVWKKLWNFLATSTHKKIKTKRGEISLEEILWEWKYQTSPFKKKNELSLDHLKWHGEKLGLRQGQKILEMNRRGEIQAVWDEQGEPHWVLKKIKGKKMWRWAAPYFAWDKEKKKAEKMYKELDSEYMPVSPSYPLPYSYFSSGSSNDFQVKYERVMPTMYGWVYGLGQWKEWNEWKSAENQLEEWWRRREKSIKEGKEAMMGWWIHVHSTYTNTIANITDYYGNVYFQVSAGTLGFKKARRASHYAALRVGEELGLWLAYHQEIADSLELDSPYDSKKRKKPMERILMVHKKKQYTLAQKLMSNRKRMVLEKKNNRGWMQKKVHGWLNKVINVNDVHVVFKGVGTYRTSVLKGLSNINCVLTMLWEGTRKPHNGCRLPKPRRL